MKAISLVLPALMLLGCDAITDIDTDGLDPIPVFEQLDFASLQPAQSTEYWELRYAFRTCQVCDDPADSAIAAGGLRTRAEIDPSTLNALDELRPQSGFAQGCLPGNCFLYVAAVQNGNVVFFNTVDALRTFLGPINSGTEALLLLRADGYWWNPSNRDTGMKASGSSWEFVALQTVRFCAPVQTDRVRLRMGADGVLRELDREVYERHNACV